MLECTKEEFEDAKKRALDASFSGFTSVSKPKALLVCGQPGAGKTYLVEHLRKENWAFVNGDTFRSFFPNIAQIKKEMGEDYIEATRPFNGKMTEAMIEELSNRKCNLIIEGTLRTTEVPIKTKNLLEAKGYDVALCVLVVRPEISYLRAKQRYADMKEAKLVPRKTDVSFQKNITDGLAKNVDYLYSAKEFKDIRLYKEVDKELTCVYSMKKTPRVNPSPMLQAYHEQKYTPREVKEIQAEFANTVSKEEMDKLFQGRVARGIHRTSHSLDKSR